MIGQAPAASAREEWRQHWPMVLCCVLGMGAPAIGSYALGQFFTPLESEFGWSRTEVQSGMSIAMILAFVLAPVVGRVSDSVNARLLALPALALAGVALAAMSLVPDNVTVWTALWCAFYIVAAFAGPPVWLAALNHRFVHGRNLAIAVALSGMSIAAALGPSSTRWFIDMLGWRDAFVALAVAWLAPPFVLSLFLFRDGRLLGKERHAAEGHAALVRPSFAETFLTISFLRLALAVLAMVVVSSAFVLHMAPALVGKGFDPVTAAAIAGSAGLAAIPAKLFTGSLFDRLPAPVVWAGLMGLMMVACALLAVPGNSFLIAVAGAWILFICAGGSNVGVACIVSRFYSGAVFGSVYGAMMAIMVIGGASGPLLASMVHDATGSYTPGLWAGIAVAALSAVLLFRLRPTQAPVPLSSPA